MFSDEKTFLNARLASGVDITEASKDLNIPVIELEQIEASAFGAFENIYDLKDKILLYSKYLGLNQDDVIDAFNEYMFDYTSKIQLDDIEREMKELEKESMINEENRVSSPYTKYYPREMTVPYLIGIFIILIFVIFMIVWSISQITVRNNRTNIISYVEMRIL